MRREYTESSRAATSGRNRLRISVSDAFLLATVVSVAMQSLLSIFVLPAAVNPARRYDFLHMFQAAALVWSGHPASIYRATLFNHLPFEAVLLSPLAPLGYKKAYLLLLAINVGALALAVRKLHLHGRWALAACTFMPVWFTLANGQDSIFTLLALSAAAAQLVTGGDLAAGGLVGITMYKPQIGLPICGLMFLWRRWRFVAGFAATATACVAVSVATVGFRGFLHYIVMLRSMEAAHGVVVWGGGQTYRMFASNIVGLRGLLSFVLSGRALLVTSVALSLALLLYAFVKGRGMRPEHQFALAIAACCLANYHMFASDLVIALIPLAISWGRDDKLLSWSGLSMFAVAAFLSFIHQSFIAVPLLVFFFAFVRAFQPQPRVAALQQQPVPEAAVVV